MDFIKRDFNQMSVMLIPIAVAVNFIGGSLALTLRLPIYLDMIGTFLVGILGGPWIGLVTGVLSVVLKSIQDPTQLPFLLVAGALGFAAGLLARSGMFLTAVRTAFSAILVSVVAVFMSIVIRIIFFGGFDTSGTSIVISAMVAFGVPFWPAQFIGSILAELPDKFISVFFPYWIIQNMSARYLIKFPNGRIFVEHMKEKVRALRGVKE